MLYWLPEKIVTATTPAPIWKIERFFTKKRSERSYTTKMDVSEGGFSLIGSETNIWAFIPTGLLSAKAAQSFSELSLSLLRTFLLKFTSQMCTFLTSHPPSSAFYLFIIIFTWGNVVIHALFQLQDPLVSFQPVSSLIRLASGAPANRCNLHGPIRITATERGERGTREKRSTFK